MSRLHPDDMLVIVTALFRASTSMGVDWSREQAFHFLAAQGYNLNAAAQESNRDTCLLDTLEENARLKAELVKEKENTAIMSGWLENLCALFEVPTEAEELQDRVRALLAKP